MPLSHHELCFGCGQANVFGLHLELEPQPEGGIAGRFFVKQDHQGPPGFGHGGLVGAALDEAMGLAALDAEGVPAQARHYEIDLLMPAPVGTFVSIRARVESREGKKVWVTATAAGEGGTVAEARGLFLVVDNGA